MDHLIPFALEPSTMIPKGYITKNERECFEGFANSLKEQDSGRELLVKNASATIIVPNGFGITITRSSPAPASTEPE